MTVSLHHKTDGNRIEQNKDECNLDEQTATISALSPGDVCKNEFYNRRKYFT